MKKIILLLVLCSACFGELILWNRLGSATELHFSAKGALVSNDLSSPTFAAGYFGNAVSQAANAGSGNEIWAEFTLPAEGCIECWIKPDFYLSNTTTGDGNNHAITWYRAGWTEFILLAIQNGAGIFFDIRDASAPADRLTVTGQNIPKDEWSHIAMSWSSANNKQMIFLNGAQVGLATPSFSFSGSATLGLNIGSVSTTTAWGFDGEIDNIKIWSDFKTNFADRVYERSGSQDRFN